MRAAVLLYRAAPAGAEARLAWVDPFAGRVLHALTVPLSPNLGVFPGQGCALVSYTESEDGGPPREWLDVYRLADWCLRAHLPMDCRAHFNGSPNWPTFAPAPHKDLIQVYKARTLGDNLAEDYLCGLDVAASEFTPWNFRLPECIAGWSATAGRAHAQVLFVGDGLHAGGPRAASLEQKVGFWLGPDDGMGPVIRLGPRPRAHSALGHARAILSAPRRPLSAVVCTDGVVHLIDPVEFRYLERQRVEFPDGHAMPLFAAQLDPRGRFLYVGVAAGEARHRGLVERVVVHDLDRGRWHDEWVLDEPSGHLALTDGGGHLCGVSPRTGRLWVRDARTGRTKAVMRLDGSPQYVIPFDGTPGPQPGVAPCHSRRAATCLAMEGGICLSSPSD
jgi:hypothetical protein